MRRILSFILAFVMVFSMLPAQAFAEETEPETQVDTGDVTIEGTNGLGNLLSDAIAEEQEEAESEYGAGYTVTDLVIDGNTATVTYDAMEEAILIVALYTEDGLQMLTSGKTTVTADATEATVTIEGTMPRYFLAKAYLVDSYDYSPLCQSYETPIYTQDMQELLASTIHDYDPERVLNLDEDETTNFAVYAEDVIRVDEVEGKNIVASIDDETNTYIIENADEQFTGLAVGDIVAYEYGENELIIVKVGSIKVDGTTVTIVGGEMELNDAFAYVKIEGESDSADATVDTSNMSEGVTYLGLVEEPSVQPQGLEYEGEGKVTFSHEFDYCELKYKGETEGGAWSEEDKVSISAHLLIQLELSAKILVSSKHQYFDFKLEVKLGTNITIEGSYSEAIKLGEFTYSPVAGLYINIQPAFEFKASGTVSFNFEVSQTFGIRCCRDEINGEFQGDVKNTSGTPQMNQNVDVEGTFFVGFSLNPEIVLIHKRIFRCGPEMRIGGEITATLSGTATEGVSLNEDVRHLCTTCLGIKVEAVIDLSGEIEVLSSNDLKIEFTFFSLKFKIWEGHLSFDDQLGIQNGECENVEYKVTVKVVDSDDDPVPEALVYSNPRTVITNRYGYAELYLPKGLHKLHASSEDYEGWEGTDVISVEDTPRSVKLVLDEEVKEDSDSGDSSEDTSDDLIYETPSPGDNLLDEMSPEEVIDCDEIVASGACGDNLIWRLTESGRLVITGTGDMYNYTMGNRGPWGSSNVKLLYIEDGVTSIGDYAFYWCPELRAVRIPDSVTSIGAVSFVYCRQLRHVTFGEGVTYIGNKVFELNAVLSTLRFNGDAPEFHSHALYSLTATAYYPADNPTWTSDVLQDYGGIITWIPYTLDEYGDLIADEAAAVTMVAENKLAGISAPEFAEGETLSPNAIFGGEYDTEISDTYPLKTASFSDLVPGGEYLLLALKSIEVEDYLAADNLLFVDQAAAGEDGTLTFTYVQRETCDISYVVACGPSNKDLADAAITFPEMTADGELQAVNPVVVYDGETLTEGRDYIIVGTVSFTEAGEYTCYIQGIRSYTGLVECTYTVNAAVEEEEYTVKWYSGSTSMNGTIDLNIYVLLSENLLDEEDAFVRFTYAGKTVDVPMADALHSPVENYENRYRFTCQIYAKQVADNVNVKVMKGDEMIGTELNYSVKQYCDNLIRKNTSPEQVAMCKAILNYGAAAQLYFNYNTDNLANASLSEEDKVLPTPDLSEFAYIITGSEDGIKAKSATVMMESELTIRVYFTLTGDKSIDEYIFTVDGQVVTPKYNEKGYYIEFGNIAAKRMDEMHEFKVGGITVTYGVLSYVNSKLSASDPLEVNLAKALYAYYAAAKDLLG